MRIGCLYMLIFPNGKRYVGITSTSLRRRIVVHMHHARKGRPGAVQSAIRKYGSFEIVKLTIAEWSYLVEMEKRAITVFGTKSPDGYNLTDGGEGVPGRKATATQIARQSQIGKARIASGYVLSLPPGYKHSNETRAKISRSMLGRVFTAETRRKIGQSKIGNKNCTGRKVDSETRARISTAQKGKPRFSEQQKKHLSMIRKGKPWTEARRRAHEEKKNGPHTVT